ncbi:hypothetical protein A8B79_00470 [Balneola sp. EhC07]|uniref:hypothetical protein n=1 Tax=Balneola sp. EhC07 TaxID=1849360 RepID=UPI0007F383E0|nr:hypothetical protein [Balneola sp. EhC07]OAN64654.1 hypothetical protein A8B79_00470 [Balneola sp. EhC07]
MRNSKEIICLLMAMFLIRSTSAFAHTGFDSDAGILSNIIAVGVVLLSIFIYFLMSNRKRKKGINTPK